MSAKNVSNKKSSTAICLLFNEFGQGRSPSYEKLLSKLTVTRLSQRNHLFGVTRDVWLRDEMTILFLKLIELIGNYAQICLLTQNN